MKILILSFYYQPDLCAGSFRCAALVQALRSNRTSADTIEVITTVPNRYDSYSSEAPESEKHEGLSIYRVRLPSHQSGMLDQSKAFLQYARKVRSLVKGNQYDLVYATSSRLLTAALGAYVVRNNTTPLYLDIRDIFVDTIKDVLPKKLAIGAKPIFDVLERWTINKASKVNLVSKGFRPYFEEKYPKQEFSYFTNGIDSIFLNCVVDSVGQRCDSDKPISILYAGNFGEGQGLHNIVPQLAKKLGNKVHFYLIGDGGRRKQLEDELIKLDCSNVSISSPIKRDDLLAEYQRADVLFLHLNDYDAFRKVLPSKIFEYAALGKPILAGVSGYAAEFVEKEVSNAKLFHPCNIEEAELALLSLELRDEPRNEFVEKFSRSNIMKQMAEDICNTL